MKRNFKNIFIVVGILFFYAVIWFVLAFPYRPFPADDLNFLDPRTLNSFLSAHNPVFIASIKFFSFIWTLFSANQMSSLLMQAVFFNTLSLLFLSIIIFRITDKISASIIGMILYATSAWPTTYYFMASYAPLASMLNLLVILLIAEAYLRDNIKFLIPAGLFSALFFLSTPSAPVMIVLHILMIFYFFLFPPFKKLLTALFFYLTVIFLIAVPHLIYSDHVIIGHWLGNQGMNSHYQDALNLFGYAPKSPFFSFFHIGGNYAPAIFIFFVIFSFLFLIVRKKYNSQEKVISMFFAAVYFHSFLIDLLPFTKLGRTNFPAYPLVIIALVIAGNYLINYLLNLNKLKKFYLYSFIVFFFALAILSNINYCWATINARKHPGDYLSDLALRADLYLFKNDIHAEAIKTWLNVNIKEIDALEQIKTPPGREVALIIGPHGSGSGKSLVRHSTAPDFILDENVIKKPIGAEEIKIPYYMYLPPFLFEEEVSQALYFSGKSPYYKADNMKLTIWLWEKK